MRKTPRVALALFAALLLVLGVGACGEDSDGELSATTTAEPSIHDQLQGGAERPADPEALPTEGGTAGQGPGPTTPPPSSAPATTTSPSSSKEESRRDARRREAYERKRYGAPSPQSAPFAKYSGPASEGKLHLAEFGEEADGGERAAVGAAIAAYLAAAKAGEWASACRYLAAASQAQGASCPKQLATAFSPSGGLDRDELPSAPEGVASLRIETGGRAGEGAGFALFHGGDGSDYWVAVKREDGDWRLLSVTPQPFAAD